MGKFKLNRILSTGLLAIVLLVSGCAGVHTTQSGAVGVQRQQYMSGLVSEQALQQEAAQQYSSLLSQARAQGKLDTNAAQTRRVKSIAQRLIAQAGVFRSDAAQWNWEVHVLNDNQVNAWCMPGGKIAVYSGLISRLNPTDDELAAVIGHEIAHALREHSREQVSQQMATQLGVSVLAAVTGSRASADLGNALTNVMFTLPNSRTHEVEADRIGTELAARAGYNPNAAVSLWQKMAALDRGSSSPEFLSTHPSADSRIQDLQVIANQVMPLYEQTQRR
ncbi:MAG: M48 family metallopeptidase [Pusillimonas sp.]|nr:M48 family metallopeptidase [Pusillimonas sp.]